MGIKAGALSLLSRGKFFTVAHAPEICMVAGTIELGLTIYSAAKGALKFKEVYEDHKKRLAALDEFEKSIQNGVPVEIKTSEYGTVVFSTMADVKAAKKSAFFDLFKGFGKCFWKTMVLAFGTVFTYGAALHIVNHRLADAIAVGSAALTRNKELEDHILKNEGPDKLAEALGCKEAEVLESHVDPETGETVVDAVRYSGAAPAFSVEFDEENPNFEKRRHRFYNTENGDYPPNLTFVDNQQVYANTRFRINRHLFVNELLTIYGYKDKDLFEDGWSCGWKYYDDPEEAKRHGAANYIDIGINHPINKAFREGKSDYCTLILNVDPEPIVGAIGYKPRRKVAS